MVGGTRLQKTTIDRRRAKALMFPIAAFFHAGGLTKRESLAAFSAAIDKILKGEGRQQMEHIGPPTPYADVVAAWMRHKQYLDPSGCPRILPLTGPHGFTTLVNKVSPGTKAQNVLSVLLRYRNIRRVRDGRYELVRPFFNTDSDKAMAFEPIAYFLSDASATLSQILKRQRLTRGPEQFWRKVESIYVSEASATKFAAFARERSLLFLEELDDWLEAHGRTTSGTRKRRRVGLGLFSIYSRPEAAAPKR